MKATVDLTIGNSVSLKATVRTTPAGLAAAAAAVLIPPVSLAKGLLDKTAVFREINLDNPHTHHDALEFPDGRTVLLNMLDQGQYATVLQLPVTHQSLKTPHAEPEKV
jgi:hypothetical protein